MYLTQLKLYEYACILVRVNELRLIFNHPGQTPRFGAAAISILLELIRQYYLNIRQYY